MKYNILYKSPSVSKKIVKAPVYLLPFLRKNMQCTDTIILLLYDSLTRKNLSICLRSI